MPMHLKTFRKWIRQIYATRDEELDCNEFFEAIPKYVDVEVTGEKANLRFPEIEHHLNQCPQCYDLYLTLRQAALLESRVEPLESQQIEPIELLESLQVEPLEIQQVALLGNQQAAQQIAPEPAAF
ncbi:MAG: hypothetical protein SXV54_12925 [Chloroflexota bacterium]|nr:hypothetical protein [Chloroflexota bacterium]